MTVLDSYQRLEAEAVWRTEGRAQSRNVVVSIGNATLTITNLNDVALTHWSLAALHRINPGAQPAHFAPGQDAAESIEIADPEMIEALERVMQAIRLGGTRKGRLRLALTTAVFAVVALLAVVWLPGALARYAAGLVPEAARADLGTGLMTHVETLTGAPCDTPGGRAALAALQAYLFPDGETRLHVLPSALAATAHLPGGHLLIGHRLVEDHENANQLTKAIWTEAGLRSQTDPVERLLADAGLTAILRLLTSGEVPDDALRRHAEALLRQSEDATAILASPVTQPQTTVLNDSQWIALQSICLG